MLRPAVLVALAVLLATSRAYGEDEVRVSGATREAGRATVGADDARELAGALDDPLRAVTVLPGVVPLRSATPLFFVRGAPPGDVGFFVEGVRIPTLFHAALGPSVLQPGALERVDVWPGPAPARYGGVAGAVLAATLREPDAAPHVEAAVRDIDASGLATARFERSSVSLGGRWGYPNAALAVISPSTRLDYADLEGRATYALGEHDRVTLLLLASADAYASQDAGPDGARTRQEIVAGDFEIADVRWDEQLSEGHVRLAATVGRSRIGAAPLYAVDTLAGVRAELEKRLGGAFVLRGGAESRLDAYRLDRRASTTAVPNADLAPPTNTMVGAWTEATLRPGRGVDLTPGLRVGVFSSSRREATAAIPAVDPRLAARIALAPRLAWIGTVGVAHQVPPLRVGAAPGTITSIPGFAAATRRLEETAQTSQGVEGRLPGDLSVAATGFLSGSRGLVDLTSECSRSATGYTCSDVPGRGVAYGLELSARRSLSSRIGGWLSYTLSRATRDGAPSELDRTHVANAAVSWDAGRRWRLGARLAAWSGQPYPRSSGVVGRFPPFVRGDLLAEKRWPLGEGFVAASVELQNVTLAADVTGVACRAGTCTLQKTTVAIPIVGLEASL